MYLGLKYAVVPASLVVVPRPHGVLMTPRLEHGYAPVGEYYVDGAALMADVSLDGEHFPGSNLNIHRSPMELVPGHTPCVCDQHAWCCCCRKTVNQAGGQYGVRRNRPGCPRDDGCRHQQCADDSSAPAPSREREAGEGACIEFDLSNRVSCKRGSFFLMVCFLRF